MVRSPCIEAVLRDIKRAEYRSRPITIRGRFFLDLGRARYGVVKVDEMLAQDGIRHLTSDRLPRSEVVGTAELVDVNEEIGEFYWRLRHPERSANRPGDHNRCGSIRSERRQHPANLTPQPHAPPTQLSLGRPLRSWERIPGVAVVCRGDSGKVGEVDRPDKGPSRRRQRR